jgi:hypothetical protein
MVSASKRNPIENAVGAVVKRKSWTISRPSSG